MAVARVAWSRRIAVFAALAGLAFVLVGTWARQFVWTGRPLPPGSGFGEGPALAGALGGAPGLLAVGLALVVVAGGVRRSAAASAIRPRVAITHVYYLASGLWLLGLAGVLLRRDASGAARCRCW